MSGLRSDDTIVAVATGTVSAGLAVLRISGSAALDCLGKLVARPQGSLAPRRATLAPLVHPVSGARLDEAIILYFQAPASLTGEDVVELQCHGGALHVASLLEAAVAAGARVAEPGEFSRRAFFNERVTLERAEAIADLVGAETEAALGAARAQMFGALGVRVEALVDSARGLQAEVEGTLDFPDEAEEGQVRLLERSMGLAESCEELLASFRLGAAVRNGIRVVLAGPPNVGKSSLFNALLGEDRAIVDEVPGTTRDFLEGKTEIDGIACVLVDTAGIRDAPDRVELQGIARARAELARSDVAVWVQEATGIQDGLTECLSNPLLVVSKCDQARGGGPGIGIRTSARTGEGLEDLRKCIAARFQGNLAGRPKEALVTNQRHAALLATASSAFRRAASGPVLEMVAYDLREGVLAMDQILGRGVLDEALLDAVFSRFCIGK